MKYDPEDWENYHKGIRLFNREKFYEAHEAWEEIWRRTKDADDKRFLQGLIQAAALLVHVQKGRGKPALDLHKSSSEKLGSFRRGYWGADIDQLLSALQKVREKLEREEAIQEFPKLHFLRKTPSKEAQTEEISPEEIPPEGSA